MIVFSFLMEGASGRQEYLSYKPKHPLFYYGPIIGSTIAGGMVGYNIGQDQLGMKHPGVAGVIGSLNGLNAGMLAGEYLDRKQRENEGKPYEGPRTMSDAGNEFLIKTGIGNVAALPIAASGIGSFAPALISAKFGHHLAPLINDRLSHPEVYNRKKK